MKERSGIEYLTIGLIAHVLIAFNLQNRIRIAPHLNVNTKIALSVLLWSFPIVGYFIVFSRTKAVK